MKVSIDKVQLGLTKYINSEMVNHLDGWQKIGLGATTALIIRNLPNTIETFKNKPVLAMLGVIDEDNNIDIDALHDAVADYFSETGEYIDLPLIGRFKFTRQDIEALYHSIKEA